MRRTRTAIGDTARALRVAARAARLLDGDPIAASLLVSALTATPTPERANARPVGEDLLAVRLAAEHGMKLQEFLSLDPDDLIDLLWPPQKPPGAATTG